MEAKADFKTRLKEAMTAKGLRSADIVEMTGIPKVTISYYLSGKTEPKSDRVYTLAKLLGVSEAWLLGYDVPKARTAEQKKNDDLVKVIAQLRSDPEFFEVVAQLAELPAEEYASIKSLISALRNK
jgi:transcriptional regulator with XRE-family HTH domain